MTQYFKCDVCGKILTPDKLIRLVAYRKNKMATKLGNKSLSSKDVCVTCYENIFDGDNKK